MQIANVVHISAELGCINGGYSVNVFWVQWIDVSLDVGAENGR